MKRFDCLYFSILLASCCPVEAAPSPSPKYVANATITPMVGTVSGNPGTGSHTSASMCAVQRHGLAPILNGPPGPADVSTACSCNAIVSSVVAAVPTVVTGMHNDGSLWSETQSVSIATNPAYVPPTDCCVECLISAADVQILYWPIETGRPNISSANIVSITAARPTATPSSYVDESGMTFISPSVYVAYRSLRTAYNCPAFGPSYFGLNATDTTIGYPPEALSTSMCNGPPAGFQIYTAINYTELQYPTGAQTQGTCQQRIGKSGTPRGPVLSLPTGINQIDPAWSSCKGAFEGSFDPPSALRKATAMVAPTPPLRKGPSATPGASVPPVNAPPTATPAPVDPGSGDPESAPASSPTQPPIHDPGSTDPGNSGPANVDPVLSNNSPANPNNGSPADPMGALNTAPNQDGALGSSADTFHDSNPANSASGSAAPNPAPNQNGASGSSSDPSHDSKPANPRPVSSNGETDPGTGAAGSASAADPGTGSNAGTDAIQAPNSVIINGNTMVRNPNGGIVVGSSTVMPGSTAKLAGGALSVGTDHVVIGTSSYLLPAVTTAGAVLVGNAPIVKASNGGVVLGSSTIAPGAQTIVAGQTVSIGSSHAVVDGSTYALPSSAGAVVQAAPAVSPVLVAGQSIVKAPNGGTIIGSSTLAPGSQATVAGHAVSVGSSVAAVDGTTYALPTSPGAALQQALNLAQNIALSSKITLANGAVITAGGAPATVDGTVIAIPSNDNGLLVNGKPIPLPTTAPNSVFTVAGEVFTAAPTGFSIGAQKLSPGGSAITLSGTPISLGPSGIQIGTSTIPLPSSPTSVFTVAGQTFTAAPTGFTLAGETLSPGGSAITLSGTVVSLGPSGLQIGTSTIPLSSPPTSVFTVAGQTFTAAPTGFTLAGQTLSPGGSAITLSGTVVSLGPSGLQIGTSTVPLTPAEQSAAADASAGLGGLVMGGYGAGPTETASNGTGVVGFAGAASRVGGPGIGSRWKLLVGLGVGLVLCCG